MDKKKKSIQVVLVRTVFYALFGRVVHRALRIIPAGLSPGRSIECSRRFATTAAAAAPTVL